VLNKKLYEVLLILGSALLVIFLPEASIQAAADGPDGFGYTYADSTEPGGPAYGFDNLTSPISLTLADEEMSGAIPIGFDFSYYGSTYSNLYVSSNGFLTVLPGQSAAFTPQQLPDSATPNGVIAGWWVDLDPSKGGTIQYQTLGTAPNRRFIVQFSNILRRYETYAVTMQFKLFEATNVVEVHYESGGSDIAYYSMGIENQTGTSGLSYYFGIPALTLPLAVRYSPPADVSIGKVVTPVSVTPGEAITYTLQYTNTGSGPANNVIITDVLPTALTQVSYASGGSIITLSASSTWQVAPLWPGMGGLITITGIVSPALQNVGVLTNTATITTTAFELDTTNNSSEAGLTLRYRLTVDQAGNGRGTVAPPSGTTFANGTAVTLKATPDIGTSFAGWSSNCLVINGDCVLIISANTLVTATFTLSEYPLTMDIVGNGSVIKNPSQSTYHYGDVVTLTAVPDTLWAFVKWSGDLIGSDNPVSLTIHSNTSITATFQVCQPLAGVGFTYIPLMPKVGQSVGFTATITSGTLPVTYTWNFGHEANVITTSANVVHTFPLTVTLQTYTVTLATANACSSLPIISRPVAVRPYRVYLPVIMR
jgi:uncharacterized repeat protein (TIGR01451 family)